MSKVIVTTSRRPSPRSRSLVKDLVAIIPNAVRLTRGHASFEDLARLAFIHQASRVVIIAEKSGNPGIMRIYVPTLNPPTIKNIVTFLIRGVKLAREAGTRAPAKPEVLYVESDGNTISDEIAEGFIVGLQARLLVEKPPRGAVVVKLTALREDTCLARFFYGDSQVGPELKLSKPRQMIKTEGVPSNALS